MVSKSVFSKVIFGNHYKRSCGTIYVIRKANIYVIKLAINRL